MWRKGNSFYTVGGNVNLCNHYGEYHRGSLKKLGLAFPLLGTGPEKILIQKDKYTPVFTEALFTIARTWKQSCPLTDEWIKIIVYVVVQIMNSLLPNSHLNSRK